MADAEAELEAGGGSRASGPSPVAAPVRHAGSSNVPDDIDLTAVEVDFSGTANMLERVVRVAETVEGTGKDLNVSQLARLIVRSGQSTAAVQNLRVGVQRVIDRHKDLFERVDRDRATYRYKGGDTENP